MDDVAAAAASTSQQTLSVGSHTFIVTPNPGSERGDAGFDRAGNTMRVAEVFRDGQGRLICQACHSAQSASTSSSAARAAQQPDEEFGAASPRLSPPGSVEAGGPFATTDRERLSALAQGEDDSMATSAGPSRRQSFTRSRTTSPGRAAGRGEVDPVVSFPTRGDAVGASVEADERASSSASAVSASRAMDVDQVADDDNDDERYGPATMTRPRLSTLAPSAQRSKSPSASRLLNRPLAAPYPSQSSDQADEQQQTSSSSSSRLPFPNVDWYQPHRPDPTRDVSRLRVPPRGRGCLYPGAIFKGFQKSGRLSYDVTVEILNVDLPNSHLDGYLNIRGLTEDWPEMTTYFEAEIIGQEHRFTTGKWGASAADDVKHWNRFAPPEFREAMAKEGAKFNHMNKPFVFMRWKERFLVPDAKIRDISGASFAGFYYVCVEFGDMDEWYADDGGEGGAEGGPAAAAAAAAAAEPTESRARAAAASGPTFRTESPTRTHLSHRRLLSAASMAAAMAGRSNVPSSPSSPNAAPSPPRTRTPISERRLAAHTGPTTTSGSSSRGAIERLSDPSYHQPLAPAEMQYRLFRRNLASPAIGSSSSNTPMAVDVPMDDVVGDDVDDANRALLRELMRREEREGRPLELEVPCPTRSPEEAPAASRVSGTASNTALGSPPSNAFPRTGSGRWGRRGGISGPSPLNNTLPGSNGRRDNHSRPSHGRITAFYYHTQSEPWQRLELAHVPQRSSASFEMR